MRGVNPATQRNQRNKMKSHNPTQGIPRIGSSALLGSMVELAERWRKRSCFAFKSAELEPNDMGKRLIQHGAMCYHNCWSELQTLVDELRASTTQSKSKNSTPPPA